jgi:arylsulfatase A-like enzyme
MGRQVVPDGGVSVAQLIRDAGIPYLDELPPLPLLLDDEVLEAQPDQASLTARYVDESVRFLRAQGDRPWFLYLAHIYVHLPIYVQERFARASRNGAYGAAVASIDWAAAVLLAELDRLGLADDTIVIFTSDNGSLAGAGGGSNAPLRGTKGTTWEGGMRVPCLVRWPGHVPAGSECSAVATSMDLLPTLAAVAGASAGVPADPDRPIDGRDITALLRDPAAASPHEAFYFYAAHRLEAVRSGRWKLHLAKGRKPMRELYDLVADVGETTDVAADHPSVVSALEAHAEAARRDLGDSLTGAPGSGRRPVGQVDDPVTLTTFDPDHPYYLAEYDLPDRG